MPQGATPRSLTIHLRGPLTRSCKPGDSVTVAGVFLPQPYTGFRAMRAGLLTTTFLEAMSVKQDKRSYKDAAADDTLHAQIEVCCPLRCVVFALVHCSRLESWICGTIYVTLEHHWCSFKHLLTSLTECQH